MILQRLVFLAIGVLLGGGLVMTTSSHSTSKNPTSAASCADYEKKMQALADRDYRDYLATTDSKVKIKMGDELLAKIMMLFIADIGVRMVAARGASPPIATSLSPDARAPGTRAQQGQAVASPTDYSPQTVTADQSAELVINKQMSTFHVDNEEQIADVVKAHQKPNLFETVRTSRQITVQHARLINGTYTGDITFQNGDVPWQIEWTVRVDVTGNRIQGQERIKLSKQGKVFSDHNGDGEIDSFTGTPGSVIARANGDKGYMELFPAENLGMIVGTYYDRKSVDQFIPIGTVVMRRQ